MKKASILAVLGLALALTACDKSDDQGAANNTKRNARDQGGNTLTPGDQGNNEVDRTITQQVRQGVMKDDALSTTAKNVKIITVDGVVTLRGPVKNDQEKSAIAALAQQTGNVKRVDNQLEVSPN